MKTKNFLLTGALLIVALFSVNGVMAQAPTSNKADQTTVNIVLKGIQSIVVDDNVTLEYTTITNYNDGVNEDYPSHLVVYSVGPFAVRVTSTGKFKNGETEISEGTVTITPTKVTPTSTGDIIDPLTITTGTGVTNTQLIKSDKGGFGIAYNVNYKHQFTDIPAAFANSATETGVTYKADVTYEIAAN